MSYLHCPACRRAYHASRGPACPSCGAGERSLQRLTDELVARLAAATPAEREAAEAVLSTRCTELVRVAPPARSEPSLRGLLATRVARAATRVYAKFLVAKSQFTSVQNASQNFGRAFR